MDVDFIRGRITELRMKKGVSEYQMSLDLGHAKNYIREIVSGRTLPSLVELLNICDYLSVSPKDFFDSKISNPSMIQELLAQAEQMEEGTLAALINLMNKINPA